MSLIYFSSSSSHAEIFSMRIADQCESYLKAECIVPNLSNKVSQQKIRDNIEACDVLIVVINNHITSNVLAYNLIDNERIRGDAYAVSGNIDQARFFYEEQRLLAESKCLPAYAGSSYSRLGYVYVKQKNRTSH
jgi:hypothetical protein